ncbi:ABC transporter ATP-binding protein [Streptomyces sp. NBC_00083]|uniref:ATP-binding cassette domain-containing protein n=1 Tax=Streptomyces sp. NBC_00083 TaxID=2975647 RepID=UPI0022583FD6|nr:ABC transporter ATP-binding protein [Streptomyces sp. NBC_00083]MCX5382734.1 ABC transporter ATP-binding protein/permease [Streptomyces sp. NBC_00083]
MRETIRQSAGPGTLILFLSCASAGAGLALPAALGRALDLVLGGRQTQAGPWIALCVTLTVLAVLVGALESAVTATATARSAAWLRRRVLGHVLDAETQQACSQGELVARLTGNAVQGATVPVSVAGALAAVLTPVGGLVALALTDWLTAVVVLAGLPLFALLLKVFVRGSGASSAGYLRVQGEIAGRLLEAVRGAGTIAAAGHPGRDERRILAPLPELSRQGHRMWEVLGRSTAQAAVLLPLLQLAVLAVAGLRVAGGDLSVGGLLAAWRYAALATGTGSLVGMVNTLTRGRTALDRLQDVLAAPVTPYGTSQIPAGVGELTLRGVTHGPLRDLDLTVPGGSVVAVVGRTGSGKSALAAVAGRLADPEHGTVALDGVPLPALARTELRRAVGYAFARPTLLGATIGATIAYGAHDPGGAAVRDAARAACADDFIRTMPDGYATPCASAPLSGGECQRLGLARAFAHRGRLLILDDATSSLDSATELKISQALLHGGGTRLIIALKASTAARADLVVWLEDGRPRAVAPHHELYRLPDYRAVFGEAEAAC